MMRSAFRPILLSLGLLIGLTSCAPNGGLDVAALEDAIQQDLVTAALSGFADQVGDVTCPAPLKPAEGETVECTVEISDRVARVLVTFGEGRGEVTSAVVQDRLVDIAGVERAVAQEFAADTGINTELRCPAPVMVLPVGESAICEVEDARGVIRLLTATPNADGTIAVSFSDAS